MIWFGSMDSTTISWNTHSNLQILLNLCELFTAGMAVHKFSLGFVCTDQWTSRQQCMEVRKAIIPDWNVTRMRRKLTMSMFWEMTIESKLLNQFQWSWYHSFQKTIFYLMKSKYAICLNIKVTKIERSSFWGTSGIAVVLRDKAFWPQLCIAPHFLLYYYMYLLCTLVYLESSYFFSCIKVPCQTKAPWQIVWCGIRTASQEPHKNNLWRCLTHKNCILVT